MIRAGAGEVVPDALVAVLKRERIACGGLRASGVLAEGELRAFDGGLRTLGRTRRIAGPVHALALEGSIGLVDGEPSVSLRALLARESDRGLETLAGEVASAKALALEAFVTSLDDISLERSLDEGAGVWLLGAPAGVPATTLARATAPKGTPAAAWAVALEASEHAEPARPRGASTGHSPVVPNVPARPPRPEVDLDGVVPEGGDIVEHFAFGRCQVLRSDGDRLHLKVGKDGRVREIALEMLRVTPLAESEDGPRRFKLDRRL